MPIFKSYYFYSIMILIVTVWIILITTTHQVENNAVITVNNNGTTDCCVGGKNCSCSSLFFALQNITDSTIVNITSESVELHSNTTVPSTSNISITSNKTVIKCNNTGSVSFINTTNVTIHGIIWDQCGNPNDPHVNGGIHLSDVTILTIDNCTFQHSQLCAVVLSSVSGDITIKDSYFISNGLRNTTGSLKDDCGGLKINTDVGATVTIVISDSVFSGNGRYIGWLNYSIYGLFIEVSELNQVNITLTINRTNFVSNFGGIYLKTEVTTFSTFILSEVNVSDNINEGIKVPELQIAKGGINLMILNSIFSNNGNGGLLGYIFAYTSDGKINVIIENTNFTDNRAVNFSNRALSIAISSTDTIHLSVYVRNSIFVNNKNGTIYISTSQGKVLHLVYFHEVLIKDCVATGSSSGSGSVSISLHSSLNNTYYFQSVYFIANNYSGITGGALFLKTANAENDIFIYNCVFQNNIGLGEGAAIYVSDGVMSNADVYKTIMKINSVNFTSNSAGDSIVYIEGGTINNTRITLQDTHFTNNNGTALHLSLSQLTFVGYTFFENTTANSGAALYLEQGSQVYFGDINDHHVIIIQFVNNRATQYGGAIYADLPSTCPINGVMFRTFYWNLNISFMNNKAGIIGNSMYFNIHELCTIDTNVSSINSLFYFPYKFNYSEAYNKSIITSPHSVVLYFPNHDGSYISNETVFIRNKILGKAITFTGAIFDYISSPAEPTQFHIQCLNGCTNYFLADDRLLIDNVSLLTITLSGSRIDFNPVNITLSLTSILASFNKQITLQLIIELSPCYSGYFYDVHSNNCVCYNHKDIVGCYDDYNEIKRGYWFGTVTDPSKPTVSLCPSRYCYFGKHRNGTRQGYCILPSASDDQCHVHRTGVACGECKPGYTLAYDSPDCINKLHKCSPGMSVLVIVLTILYWISVVAVVFILMHFSCKFQIPSGYAYGIIYYYSIVDILSNNNPYISDAVFQVIAVLSSFAKLTPQLFGQLCLVQGLSGIDQQFIHYTHALAVLLMLLIIVLIARYSPRLAFYVRRYIISVICILLLLSYTSLASTSLQLLRATHYPGYDGLYVYVSPDMKYFNNRHGFYGVVALLCGVIVVIGLPLFLLLEPLVLNRWFNFVRVKPLLDQFQSCYKNKYRWFAAYYLICRQVIIIIVYFGNDYYEMLYYLQTACVVIAMLHIWIQPYKSDFLNAFDGIVLLTIILVVNANTFTILSSATSVIIIVLLLLPLIVFCVASSKKLILHYTKSQDQQQYNLIDDANHVDNITDDMDNNMNNARYIAICWALFLHILSQNKWLILQQIS